MPKIRHEPKENFSLRALVIDLQQKAYPDGLTVKDVIDAFGGRGHAFLLLFFGLPFIQPVPLFGLSTPVGIIIATIGIFMAIGRKPWLPKFVLRIRISFRIIESSCNVLGKLLSKTEKMIRPRYGWWFSQTIIRFFNGLLIALMAFLLALPLPIPLTNLIPAYFIVINALSWLERDGMLLLLSYAVGIFGLVFFAGITGAIIEAIHILQARYAF